VARKKGELRVECSYAARVLARQLEEGLPYTHSAEIEVFVFFTPERLARFAGTG